ncbi:spore germination protein GerW family protein [Cellulomonas aerilata]|uniref:Sporulation protein YtfJ n=1 Tax=Cellulomonas aerilata TaxID=515326 RepID=A0A512DGD9_9CELL|nr:spore germination protein GerW family protein [Cellulomonas aerilata]GEO35525.1 hypothetical protein CAE01nite_32500 [Cellulomonas aerilata]
MDRTGRRTFDPSTLVSSAADLLTVRRAFGEAYERDGVRVIPVAQVHGGTGLGYGGGDVVDPADGKDSGAGGEGGGGGFGVRVRPVGVYVLDDAGVHWRPALDLNRVVLGGQLVGMVVVVALARALRRRRR